MNIRVVVVLVGLFVGLPSIAWGQVARNQLPNYFIKGIVVNEQGAPIRQAQVTLTTFEMGAEQTTFTDDEGRFTFIRVGEQSYNVTVSANGYAASMQTVSLNGGGENIRVVLVRQRSASGEAAQPVSATDLAAPDKARQQYESGRKELARGNFDKGTRHLRAAIEIYPAYASAYSSLGMAYLQMRKMDLAREALAKAIELNGDLAEARLGMGLICNQEQVYPAATEHLLKARELRPADWHVHYELGYAYFGLSQLPEAEQSLLRARAAHPDYGKLYLLLANTYVLQGKYTEALAEMEEFLKVDPRSPLVPEVRQRISLLKAELAKQP